MYKSFTITILLTFFFEFELSFDALFFELVNLRITCKDGTRNIGEGDPKLLQVLNYKTGISLTHGC
jgi:hypothetical protein